MDDYAGMASVGLLLLAFCLYGLVSFLADAARLGHRAGIWARARIAARRTERTGAGRAAL